MTAWVGTGFQGESRPWTAARARRFVARGATERDLTATGVEGGRFGWTAAEDRGGLLVAFESSFAAIELEAGEFDRYLELEGLEGPRAVRARLGAAVPGRERYARCAKSWVAGADAKRLTRPVGLTLELVPVADPSRSGPFRARLLHRGHPLPGALVRAWRQPLATGARPRNAARRDSTGPAAEARTDAGGMVRLPISGDGEWLVSAVHMVPSADPGAADWESHWASLTFARGPAIARGRKGPNPEGDPRHP